MFSFKRSVPILIGIFFLFASAFLVAPSAKQPCACVDLAPGESSEQADETSEDRGEPQRKQQKESTSSKAAPSKSESTGSVGGSGSGVTIGEGSDIKGFQGLSWGATPDMVREKFGQPTYGQWKNYAAAMRELTNNRGWELPGEVDAVLGWGEYREGDMKSDGFLWAGFSERDGRKRLVWIYKIWPNLKEGQFDYISDHQKSQIQGYFGDAIKEKQEAGSYSTYSIPFGAGQGAGQGEYGTQPAGYWWHWEGLYGYVRYIEDRTSDWVSVTYQSKLLKNSRAEFPPAGKLSNLDLGGGSGSGQSQGSDTYGQIIKAVKKGRIDGFRGTPWGATPDECLNNSKLGEPKARNGRERANQLGLNLPNEGKTVWVYEEEILGSTAKVWLSFENYHKPGTPGLIWTATTWKGLNEENYDRITGDMDSLLRDNYGEPFLTDKKREEVDSSFGFANSDSTGWQDDFGRLYLHEDGSRQNVVVQYQSQALLEKRKSEVEEAGSKF